jgi:ParB-like chromosome segregation protein Spo0J
MADVMETPLDGFDPRSPDVLAVQTDYAAALVPHSDFAKDLSTQAETVKAAGNGTNLKILAEKMEAVRHVNPYSLKIKEGWNVRNLSTPTNRSRIYALARSIADIGVRVPISVHLENDAIWVVDGHCRLMATFHAINVLGAEIRSVPIIEESKHSSTADRLAAQGIRNSGKGLETLELAELCFRLMNYGWTEQQMADRFALSKGRVLQILDLRKGVTPQVKEMINKGEITSTFAGRMIRHANGSPEKAEAILVGAVENAKSKGKHKASPKDVVHQLEPRSTRGKKKAQEAVSDGRPPAEGAEITPFNSTQVPQYHKIVVEEAPPIVQDLVDPKLREMLLASEIYKSGDKVVIRVAAAEFEHMCHLAGLHEKLLTLSAA